MRDVRQQQVPNGFNVGQEVEIYIKIEKYK